MIPDVWQPPAWTEHLRHLYFRLRACRNRSAPRRKFYRYIEVERAYLVEQGIPGELVRLVCRFLSNPRNEAALQRVKTMEVATVVLLRAQGQSKVFDQFLWRDPPPIICDTFRQREIDTYRSRHKVASL